MKFGSYSSVYANPKEVRRMLSSLSDKVDIMIVHIGKYQGYDLDDKLLDDTSQVLKIAEEYKCEIVMTPATTEFEKRRQAPLIAKQNEVDFLLIIDSDEYIDNKLSNWEGFKAETKSIAIDKYHGQYNIFGIKVEDGNQTYRALPRLWYQPEFVYYDGTHYGLKSRNPRCPFNHDPKYRKAEKHPSIEVIPFLTIRSNSDLRSNYAKQNRKDYAYLLNNLDYYALHKWDNMDTKQ